MQSVNALARAASGRFAAPPDGAAAAHQLTLNPEELRGPRHTICVTGGRGYIGAHIVRRLLAAGHTVHATARSASGAGLLADIKSITADLPAGAAERLRFFEADLLSPGSFDAAMSGCSVVLHTASPYLSNVKPGPQAQRLLVEPAIQGTENVLASVSRTPSVTKVVLTSSTVAVFSDPWQLGKDHVFNGSEFNVAHCDIHPYFYAKTMAERRAYELCAAQRRWSLCSINPGAVWGPPLTPRHDSESVQHVVQLLSGRLWPAAPPLGMAVVDVRTVAEAHSLAIENGVNGHRYLLCAEACYLMVRAARLLRREYPDRCVPATYSVSAVHSAHNMLPLFDCGVLHAGQGMVHT